MVRRASMKKQKIHADRRKAKMSMKRKGILPLDMVKSSVAKGIPIHDPEQLPANGQYGCQKCDLFFIDERTLHEHYRTRSHKRRLKEWEEKCHDQKDADRAAGLY